MRNPLPAITSAVARGVAATLRTPPQVRTIASLPWLDPGSSPVDYLQPVNLSAVMHATRLCVEPLATMPWLVRDSAGRMSPAPQWITDPMLARSDARFGVPDEMIAPATHIKSAPEFWSEWLTDALWNGRGFLLFAEDATGQPRAGTLRVVPSQHVQATGTSGASRWVVWTLSGSLEFDVSGRLIGERSVRLVMLRGEPPYDPVTGYGTGVLQRAAGDLELLARIQRYSAGVYRSGVPSGYLKVTTPTFTAADAEALKAKWMEARNSDGRTVAVLNATTEFNAIQISPEDMAVIESKRLSLLDTALAFGVPPYQLGAAQSSLTYSTTELEMQAMVLITHQPKAARVEGALSPLMPRGRSLEIDFRGMLRGDTATRTAYYSTLVGLGAMSPRMVAELEGFDWEQVRADTAEEPQELEPEQEPMGSEEVADGGSAE